MSMDFCQWWEKYKPVANTMNPHASGPNITVGNDNTPHIFSLNQAEVDHVLSVLETDPGKVWTLLDVDGDQYIVNGFHRINRDAYYITEVAFDGEFLEINLQDGDEPDDEYDEDNEPPENYGATTKPGQGR